MGTVPIWKQWLIIAASVLFSPLIMLAVACIFGWVIFRRLWLRPQVTVGQHLLRP
jgi:phosphate/sulfate permease